MPVTLVFQSTHPVWGATQGLPSFGLGTFISIHAPRVGCDTLLWLEVYHNTGISIHAPRVGCDHTLLSCVPGFHDFNPRTPCGVRRQARVQSSDQLYFNPRTPCGVRLEIKSTDSINLKFQSTHPVWGATWELVIMKSKFLFQSTHPVWGATCSLLINNSFVGISIHAPRVGCDSFVCRRP